MLHELQSGFILSCFNFFHMQIPIERSISLENGSIPQCYRLISFENDKSRLTGKDALSWAAVNDLSWKTTWK